MVELTINKLSYLLIEVAFLFKKEPLVSHTRSSQASRGDNIPYSNSNYNILSIQAFTGTFWVCIIEHMFLKI